MSSKPPIDEGIIDEVKVTNLFLRLGFFVRPHKKIFPAYTTEQVSDIDVFAVKFDRYLNRQIVLIEVKKNSCKFTDLFKLFGFQTYFGKANAYFASDKISDLFMDVSKKLGIMAISFSKLYGMVESVREIDEGFEPEDVSNMDEYFKIIRDTIDRELFWRVHYLWLELDPYNRFFHLQQLFVRTLPISGKKEVVWLRKELFLQAFLAIMDIAHDCVNIESSKLDSYIQDRFYNIGSSKEAKLKVKKGVDMLRVVLKELSDKQGVSTELPTIEVVPTYLDNLILLIKQNIRNAFYVNKYLQLNDLVYRANIHGNNINIDDVVTSRFQSRAIKETNDLLLRILHDGAIMPDFSNYV